MKKNEIALLIFIVGIAGLVSYWVVNSLISDLKPKPTIVQKVDAISTTVVPPDTTIFNKDGGINPTVKIKIGDQSGEQPFNGAVSR